MDSWENQPDHSTKPWYPHEIPLDSLSVDGLSLFLKVKIPQFSIEFPLTYHHLSLFSFDIYSIYCIYIYDIYILPYSPYFHCIPIYSQGFRPKSMWLTMLVQALHANLARALHPAAQTWHRKAAFPHPTRLLAEPSYLLGWSKRVLGNQRRPEMDVNCPMRLYRYGMICCFWWDIFMNIHYKIEILMGHRQYFMGI